MRLCPRHGTGAPLRADLVRDPDDVSWNRCPDFGQADIARRTKKPDRNEQDRFGTASVGVLGEFDGRTASGHAVARELQTEPQRAPRPTIAGKREPSGRSAYNPQNDLKKSGGTRMNTTLQGRPVRAVLIVGAALLLALNCFGESGDPKDEYQALLAGKNSVRGFLDDIGTQVSALNPWNSTTSTEGADLCTASKQTDCYVNLQVGHTLFVHGYGSDSGAWNTWHDRLEPQNRAAGYTTWRVSVGSASKKSYDCYKSSSSRAHTGSCSDAEKKSPYYYYNVEYSVEHSCTPNAYSAKSIGHCTSRNSYGRCTGYDRTKVGLCDAAGFAVDPDGAFKYLSVWQEDLLNFMINNNIQNIVPDRSLTVLGHSTGAPVVALFMERGYNNQAGYDWAARKVERIITVQGAISGACASQSLSTIDAANDLYRLRYGQIKIDFNKVTFNGEVPVLHLASKGDERTDWGITYWDECDDTGSSMCGGSTHDGVVNNWQSDSGNAHLNGNGTLNTTSANKITMRSIEKGYCHTNGQDDWPSYRNVVHRLYSFMGATKVHVTAAQNFWRNYFLPALIVD